MGDLSDFNLSPIESIKHINEYGVEYWLAGELGTALVYTDWRKIMGVIEKAKHASQNSQQETADHFVEINTMISHGKSIRKSQDFKLSRYACLLSHRSKWQFQKNHYCRIENIYSFPDAPAGNPTAAGPGWVSEACSQPVHLSFKQR